MHKPFQLGSISTGTLRLENLLPAFICALEPFDEAAVKSLNERLIELGFPYSHWYAMIQFEPWPRVFDNDVNAILNDTIIALNGVCPPFVYFGAHPDDGTDFGFWPDWDVLPSDVQAGKTGQYLRDNTLINVDTDGNVTVMDLDRNVLWSTV